jgi:hypothetical protein
VQRRLCPGISNITQEYQRRKPGNVATLHVCFILDIWRENFDFKQLRYTRVQFLRLLANFLPTRRHYLLEQDLLEQAV